MNKLKKQRVYFDQIRLFLASAEKKLTAANKTIEIDEEASCQLT